MALSDRSQARPVGQADLLVGGGFVLPLDGRTDLLENAAVAISGDRIIEIGPLAKLREKHSGARQLIDQNGLVMPGLVNTHTHAAMACFRGLADDMPLMQWLQEYIFPAEARLTGEIVYHSTLLSIAEMIRSGTTTFCDMYLFAKEVARAVADSGMRAWLGEVLYDFPSPNYGPLEAGIAYAEEMFTEYRTHPLITITVNPHAVYTCAPDLLTRLKRMAEKHNARYIIHLAENEDEVREMHRRCGRRPLSLLEHLGVLDEGVVADHCVALNEEEIDRLAARKVKVAHCPESNMKLGCGIAPVVQLLQAGVTVGLGTDGSASNNDVDMFREMSTAAKIHKVKLLDPTVMSAEETLRMGTMGGAELLGAEASIGSLEVGKKADLIVLDLNQPHLTPLYNIPSHLVYAANGADVIHSVINGRVVMERRKLLTIDEQDILARARETAKTVQSWIGGMN
jgi:5-methylthioadenosine/S-adenosylhomocysteine deaminase